MAPEWPPRPFSERVHPPNEPLVLPVTPASDHRSGASVPLVSASQPPSSSSCEYLELGLERVNGSVCAMAPFFAPLIIELSGHLHDGQPRPEPDQLFLV